MKVDAQTPLGLLARARRIWPHFRDPRRYWVSAIVFTVLLSLTEPLIPAMLQPLLDSGFQKGALNPWLVPLAIIGVFGVRGLSNFIALMSLAKIANEGVLKIRKRMFAKLLNAELSLFSRETSSSLSNTLVYETQNGSMLLVHAMLTLARDSLTVLALLGYLLFLNWKLTLIVALMFPAVAVIVKLLTRRLYRIVRQGQTATDQMAYVIEENAMAHREIRLQGAQTQQFDRFSDIGATLRRIFMKSTAASAAMTPITQIIAAIALAVVVTMALYQSGQQATTVGEFAAFVTGMLMLIAPVKHLSEVTSQITRGLASIERGLDLIESFQDETGGTFTADRALGNIQLEQLSVQYKSSEGMALDCVTLKIAAGSTVALVGASGSGKTTLVNVLPRFVGPTGGSVTIDGVATTDWDLASLRSQFALVGQHVFMLNDTIAANVALGQSVDEKRVWQSLESANLGEYVKNLPDQLQTVVGHNAMQLSGGQRQRLAIARAIYKDAPILILDEATSALDAESERAVQEALERLMHRRTTIVIAHRLSTVQHADRIVVMHAGKIIESGSHTELLALDGQYAKYYKLGLP